MPNAIADAFARGRAALGEGDLSRAGDLLEYAHRCDPENGLIALSLASLRIRRRDPAAVGLLRQVATGYDVRDAWHALSLFQLSLGQAEPAARDLARFLARHAPLGDPAARSAYDAIAKQAGAPGWSGVTGDGVVTVSLPAWTSTAVAPPAGLVIDLDGRKLAPGSPAEEGRAVCPLPAGWQQGRRLEVRLGERPLIGSPHDLTALARSEGVVWWQRGALAGWVWLPADPDRDPVVTVRAVKPPHRSIRLLVTESLENVAGHKPLARPRRLYLSAADFSALGGAVEVTGSDGRQLYGSPLVAETAAPRPASRPAPLAGPARRRGLDVVIPVHGGRELTLACLRRVEATLGPARAARIVVIDDASPDAELAAALDELAREGRIVLDRKLRNRGFPAAANAGLRLGPDRDAVLLNSDTLVPPGWLERLREAAYSAGDIGTVTPLSNNATILSYPSTLRSNPVPSAEEVARLDSVAQAANPGLTIDIPTAVGFCMYIRRDCLDQTGGFHEELFAQGYGEENDFCRRAERLGWRHVALAGLYVGHVGGQSFSAVRHHLAGRNLRIVNLLHPGYESLVAGFQAEDPLAPARRRMDALRWQAGRREAGSVILIGHAGAGGVRRRLLERCGEIRAEGVRPILLLPGPAGAAPVISVSEDEPEVFPNLRFALPAEQADLLALLRAERPALIELHHWIGHHSGIFGLARDLGVPCEVVVHDYSWFCPRVTLTGPDGRYCGEPPLAQCETCVTENGGCLDEEITPTALRQRARAVLDTARRISAPSRDTARRMERQFAGLRCAVEPPEDDALPPRPPRRPRPPGELLRVCLVGGISRQKGYEYIMACARDAVSRRLPLRFALVGHSCDDAALLQTGVVSVTGPYEEAEVQTLIRQQAAHVGFLPALWPETWSYALSEMWQAGLDVFVFDLGAPAERVARRGRGLALPLGLPAPGFNDLVLRVY